MGLEKFSAEEQEMCLLIHDSISQMVDAKSISLDRLGSKIDRKALEEECETLFFQELQKKLDSDFSQTAPFIAELKEHHPALYKKLESEVPELTQEVASCNSIADLKKLSRYALSQEELAELHKTGIVAFRERQYERAFLYFCFLSLSDPTNPEMWLLKGMSAQNLGRYPEALEAYISSLTLSPGQILTQIQIIQCLIVSKQPENARKFYDLLHQEIHAETFHDNPFIAEKLKALHNYFIKAPI